MKDRRGICLLFVLALVGCAFLGGFFLGRNPSDGFIHPDNIPPAADFVSTAPASTGSSVMPVNINTATAEQLQTLPGIGPSLAQRILSYREEHGPFASVAELTKIEGIGSKRLEDLLGYITTGGNDNENSGRG